MRVAALLVLLLIAGCGYKDPGKNPEPVEVSGHITKGGKPVSDVVLNFQSTGEGTQAAMPVKGGDFRGTITPGKYTYYISEVGGKAKAFAAIPEKYRAGAMDRQIEIESGKSLDLTLD
jgi:hypothetical protein